MTKEKLRRKVIVNEALEGLRSQLLSAPECAELSSIVSVLLQKRFQEMFGRSM